MAGTGSKSGRPKKDHGAVIAELKRRYAGGPTCSTVAELKAENPDLASAFSTMSNQANELFGMTLGRYFIQEGILARKAALRTSPQAAQKKPEKAKAAPGYDAPVYIVEKVTASGADWALQEYEDELLIADYLGDRDHVILPVAVDGRTITGIANYAFEKCKATTVEIPGTFREVPRYFGFQNQNITTVIIGEGVESLEDSAFFRASNLENVQISRSVKMVKGSSVLRGTKWFDAQTGHVIAGRVLLIFRGKGTTLEVPRGVTTVAELAAPGNIRKVILSDTVTTLCKDAFAARGNEKIQTFQFTDALVEIGSNALGSMAWLDSFGDFVAINNQLYRCTAGGATVTIPDGVTKICADVFRGNTAMKKVVLPQSLVEIGSEAFGNCKSLKSVTLSGKLSQIGSFAFNCCTALESIAIPDSVTAIGDYAFTDCKALKEVRMGQKVAEIGESAFARCASLQAIRLSKKLGRDVLSGCRALRSVELAADTEAIPPGGFTNCAALTRVTIPEGVTEIGDFAFTDCKALERIDLPEGLKEIGRSAFHGCTGLTEMTIPAGVAAIGDNAFLNCTALTRVTMAGTPEFGTDVFTNTPYVKNAFGDFVILGNVLSKYVGHEREVVIPDSVTAIGENAFTDCKDVVRVTFGSGLRTIGPFAFCRCTALEAIDLSRTAVTEVGEAAFYGCTNVKYLILPGSMEQIAANAFSGICAGTVVVPRSVCKVEKSAFRGVSELVIYDNIDLNTATALEGVCQGFDDWYGYHITVRSAETEEVRCRIFCDADERMDYQNILRSAWGAGFRFEDYDGYFLRTRSRLGRAEMAFCRMEYPEGLTAEHRGDYEAYLERCMFIERSAKRIAAMIARQDAVGRLEMLHRYGAIDGHNIGWIREQMVQAQAEKCLQFLDEIVMK